MHSSAPPCVLTHRTGEPTARVGHNAAALAADYRTGAILRKAGHENSIEAPTLVLLRRFVLSCGLGAPQPTRFERPARAFRGSVENCGLEAL